MSTYQLPRVRCGRVMHMHMGVLLQQGHSHFLTLVVTEERWFACVSCFQCSFSL